MSERTVGAIARTNGATNGDLPRVGPIRRLLNRAFHRPYTPVSGAFGLGGYEGVRVAALVPASVLLVAAGVAGSGEILLASIAYGAFASVPAFLCGGVVGRFVAGYALKGSLRRVTLQGALFGAAVPLTLGGLFANWATEEMIFSGAALILICTVAGAAAARGVARWMVRGAAATPSLRT